jgi:hypothetical protein
LIAVTMLVVLVNFIVDPYDVFGTPRITAISILKPSPRDHTMLSKTYQVARAHPVTVVAGSSVAYLGIDSFSAAWPSGMAPVYNYGSPGSYTSNSLRTLQEAVFAGGVRNAVVFLDFQNFFIPEPAATFTENDRRFRFTPNGAANPFRPWQMAEDMFLSLATMSALLDSVTTAISQGRPDVLNLAPDGSTSQADFINAARADGMNALFAEKNAFEAEKAARLARTTAGSQGPVPNLDVIAGLIEFARSHGVRLTLVIAPHHMDTSELYWRTGLWTRVEQFKTEVTTLVARDDSDVTLWDFLDYSAFSTETIPVAGDRRTPTHWFWEANHFKKQLGDIMLQRMFDGSAAAFGVALTPENVADRNAEVRAQRRAVVCDRSEPLPLPGVAKPLDDKCGLDGLVLQQHGPT